MALPVSSLRIGAIAAFETFPVLDRPQITGGDVAGAGPAFAAEALLPF